MLVQLSSHYWRPEFSAGQYRALLGDFISDLTPFSLDDIRGAIEQYRKDPANKFFPRPGALIGYLQKPHGPARRALTTFRASDYGPALNPPTRTAAQILAEYRAKNGA